jgi:hypothetical protein
MFLSIQNDTVLPIEALVKLGLSSHKDDADTIGKFGSGSKHGILVLLRAGLNPVITTDKDKITFYSKPQQMKDTQYHSVFAKVSGSRQQTIELGVTLNYGSDSWTKIDYALREFISNALDESGVEGTKIDVVSDVRAKAGHTRVFIPIAQEVSQYLIKLNENFLHFSGKNKIGVIKKDKISPMKIYYKGVFVSENEPSLFDYNCDDRLRIDETRTLSSYAISEGVSALLNDDEEAMATLLTNSVEGVTCFETTKLYGWDLRKKTVVAVFNRLYPNAVITKSVTDLEFIKAKGYTGILLRENMFNILKDDVKTNENVLTKVELAGGTIIKTDENTLFKAYEIWNKLEVLGLTNGKKFPDVKSFAKVTDGSNTLFGYYRDNCIYVNIEHAVNTPTILEELCHHITGAADGTRDFQEFAFNVASRLLDVKV